ncbi:MAG TPA: hypothetical protein VFT87_01780 [Candidatus Saccharimonadales bacterium]|nr:hypothetical protein [Candidatus Saccharimonadales bacterium]
MKKPNAKRSMKYTKSMLVLVDQLLSLPVVSLQTGQELARPTQPIIDPRHLHLVAFYCEGPNLDATPAVLYTDDIREVSSIGLIVNSAENIMSPEDLVRLQQVLNFNFVLQDKPVVDDLGNKIGKISHYAVEATTFFIIKLHVRPPLLQAWQTAERIIDRSQIIEINDKHIVVKSATKKAKRTPAPVFQSPFRGVRPQTDAMHRHESV